MASGRDALRHIVVLMMENRSFDHMLGDLKKVDARIDGLDGTESNPDSNGDDITVQPNAQYQSQLQPDPGHHFEDTRLQVFGIEDDSGSNPNMKGFIKAYFNKRDDVKNSHNIMSYFTADKVPVLTTLARKYAVFNRWFSSLPGPTLPNRAFAHFGTSFAKTEMTLFFFGPIKTIYQRMLDAGRTAKIYFFDDNSGSLGMTNIFKDQGNIFSLLDDFFDDCKSGKLPDYSFLEPNYNDHDSDTGTGLIANDQHPDHNVLAGEKLIFDVYHAIRSNEDLWKSTLLLIVYDEHGGTFDHVIPPGNYNGRIIGDPVAPDDKPEPSTGFKFDRLGVRVPAVAVSPWIQEGTVINKLFDHSSIPATVTEAFIASPGADNRSNREKNANTFLDVMNLAQPRTDPAMNLHIGKVPIFAALDPDTLRIDEVPSTALQPDRLMHDMLRDNIRGMKEAESQLPPQEQTGIDINSLKTERDGANYIKAVMERLRKYAASVKSQGAA